MTDDLSRVAAEVEREMLTSLAATGTIRNCGDVDAHNLVASWASRLWAALKEAAPPHVAPQTRTQVEENLQWLIPRPGMTDADRSPSKRRSTTDGMAQAAPGTSRT
jgi:hypothetical protein